MKILEAITGWKRLGQLISLTVCLCVITPSAFAAGIVPGNSYAWSDSIGWVNFLTPGSTVEVTDTALSGYIWNEDYGWINLSPDQSGVKNDGTGNLSGFAWGENTGYIDFSAVQINNDGFFLGYATGDIIGTLSLNCANTDSCLSENFSVRTLWRPQTPSAPPVRNTGGSGGGFSPPEQNVTPSVPPTRPSAPDVETLPTDKTPSLPCSYEPLTSTAFERTLLSCSNSCLSTPMRRGELLGLLYPQTCLVKQPESPFQDVALQHPYIDAIAMAKSEKVVQGYGNGDFRPDTFITAAESIAIIERYLRLTPITSTERMHWSTSKTAWFLPYLDYFQTKAFARPAPNEVPSRRTIAQYFRSLLILLQGKDFYL